MKFFRWFNWLNMFNKKRVRTPTLLQMEAVECGAASLGIILGSMGLYVPLEQLRLVCGVSRDGSSALNMKKAAEQYGLQARVFRRTAEELLKTEPPFIVLWEFKHFLVVEGFSNNTVYLNDPATGPRKMTFQEFEEHYSEIAMTFEKTEAFRTGGSSPSIWPGIFERLKHVKMPLIFLMLTGFGGIMIGALTPIFTKIFFDVILGMRIFSWGAWYIAFFTILLLLSGAFGFLQTFLLIRLNGKLSVQFSAEYLWHILRLPVTFYQQRFGGEIAYRLSLNDTVINSITGDLATIFLNIFFIAFYAAMMFSFNATIASIGVVATLINLFAMIYTQRTRTDAYIYLQQSFGKFMGFAIGGFNYIETIKSMGGEGVFFQRLSGYFSKYLNVEQSLGKKNSILTSIPPFLQLATKAALFGIGGYLIIHEDFTLGLFMAMQALLDNFMGPVMKLIDFGSLTQTVKTDIMRLDDVLKNPIDPLFTKYKDEKAPKNKFELEGYLELKNITFGYSRLAPPLIENFNLLLKPGQRVALVGPTGCGKTTIARLINGLFQPWSGEILFDGMPRSDLSRDQIVNTLATVDQDIFLFAGNVKDNLTLFDTTITDEVIIRAAKDAAIHEEILQKPGGYQFHLGEGGMNLSGGQRQRLEIARGFILKPKILILDEATSALDSKTEEVIIRNLRHRGCTTIMVAHRLSTIRDCDEIIVLDQGKVVQRGQHEQLKAELGIYRDFILKDIDA